MTTVRVSYGLPRKGLPAPASFRHWTDAALGNRREDAEVSIRVVDDVEGRALNMRYRHKDYPTNVLSFVAHYPDGVGANLLGDLVICAPVVAREAKAQDKPVEHHYAHLTVHGVLHLLGFDHETVAEARAMEAVERQVLDTLGVPDPYSER
ncbi:MAG TPA: rRNA maturation RNase YbeY [Xanthomonadales bacterium]|nr:rRNA maturation RNase YbeY [Xanthomonadales bacterium]